MPKVAPVIAPIPEVLKALSDEMRWSIVAQMSEVDELAATTLEQTLPVSKPTISYHVKVLYHAGLLEMRKEGRNYFYRLRREVLESVLGGVAERLGIDAGGRATRRPAGGARAARAGRPARTTAADGAAGRAAGTSAAASATRGTRSTRAARSA